MTEAVSAKAKIRQHAIKKFDDASNRVFTLPNVITFFRILLIPSFAVCIGLQYDVVAVLLIALCSFSDFLDGFFARKLKQVTKIGIIMDPCADRLMIFITLIMLVSRGILPFWAFLLIFLRETMLFFQYGALILSGKEPIRVSLIGKAGAAGLMISLPLMFLTASTQIISNFCGIPFKNFNPECVSSWSSVHFFSLLLFGISLAIYWLAGIKYAIQAANEIKTTKNRKTILISAIITSIVALTLVCLAAYFTHFLGFTSEYSAH